jgi:D-inositol-3-phosphate glycosyltransferase
MCNIAVISVHTSPLAQPGTRDSGGMNVYIRELSRQMGLRGHTMDIFTRRVDPAAPEVTRIDERTRVVQVDAGRPDAAKPELRRYQRQFRDGVLEFQRREGLEYDLVHSHYWLSAQVGRALKEEWETPHVVMFHTLGEAKNRHHIQEREPRYRIEGERAAARGADRVICAGAGEKEMLAGLYGVSPWRIAVVPGGVDTEKFRPMSRARARRKLGLDPDVPVVLYVGRIEPLKGIDVLLRAAASIDGPFRLLVVGGDAKDGERKGELRSLARSLGISRKVTFQDAVPHGDLPHYYNAADVCAVPSYYESFGLVAVEAMACGVPVVASRVGGLKETVQDGRTGYLAPWRCPEPFAERLDLLVRNEPLRRSLGREARASVERYRWQNVAARVEDVYHQLVSQYRGVAVGAHVA